MGALAAKHGKRSLSFFLWLPTRKGLSISVSLTWWGVYKLVPLQICKASRPHILMLADVSLLARTLLHNALWKLSRRPKYGGIVVLRKFAIVQMGGPEGVLAVERYALVTGPVGGMAMHAVPRQPPEQLPPPAEQ